MDVLVTGASGVLGRHVARIAGERGHTVRRLSRSDRGAGWFQADLAVGVGLAEATDGIDSILHCASEPRRAKDSDLTGTRRLLAAAAHRPHIVFPGIVGSDVIPLPYYRVKMLTEEVLESSGFPVTIQRFTQFHDLLWARMEKSTRRSLVVVPADIRFQVLDAAVAARCMVDAAEAGPAGRLDDLGGPTVYDVADLARSVAAALGRKRRRVIRLPAPGLRAAAFRAGANLTPNRDTAGETWNDYVARKLRD